MTTTPRRARSLDALLVEVNRHAPHRSVASDGWIASAAHHAVNPTSDHEPNAEGVVRAQDITHDPEGGLDAGDLARRVARLLGKHPALGAGAYVIFSRRIISTNRIGEGWRAYTGYSPHTEHVHISVASAASGYDSTRPWNLYRTATPNLDHALNDLRHARDARKRGPVRTAIGDAILRVLAIRKRVRR